MMADKNLYDFVEVGKHLLHLSETAPDEVAVAAKALKIKSRKAYYLIEIAKAFEHIPAPKEQLLRIGWTKLQILSSSISPDNYKTLLAQAEEHPVHELQQIVEGKEPTEDKHCVQLYLTPEQFELLAKVVEQHGGKRRDRGLENKEAALMKALGKLASMG